MPKQFFKRYTHDLTSDELGKLFTRETPEAYHFFAKGINTAELEGLPFYQRVIKYAQGFFFAFTMRLSPARRLMYGVALAFSVIGLIQLFAGFGMVRVPIPIALFFVNIRVPGPIFADGTLWLLGGFLLMNLLVLLEVADRLSLKRDLEVAKEIQSAMLPEGTWSGPGVEAFGLTKPANTVGGEFYDILPRPDGTVIVALGDVAGKASPAALLWRCCSRSCARSSMRTCRCPRWCSASTCRRASCSGVALHHAVPCVVHAVHRPPRIRQRRPDAATPAPAEWID